MSAAPLARPGVTCWRVEPARRVALLMDNQAYFSALSAALARARRSVLLLGWAFDPRTRLAVQGTAAPEPDQIGDVLRTLSARRAELDIRVLIWDMALPITATRALYPRRARAWFEGEVNFRLDDRHPAGACHHQKIVVIDDRLAFCGGTDISGNRWDRPAHLEHDPLRRQPSGRPHRPRHAMMIAVEGPAAAALGELARERWARATGEALAPPDAPDADPWPERLVCDLTDAPVAIARTQPAHAGQPAIREIEALYLAAIAGARHLIYLENQYFSSPRIGAALEARLAERDGPEIIVVLSRHGPSYFDRLTMDPPRDALVERLEELDRYGRFRAYAPVTAEGGDIVVHSKLMIVDDRLLRLGSANLSNRSMGLDTECDLALDAALGDAAGSRRIRRAIERFFHRLLGHYMDAAPQEVARAIEREARVSAAIEALRQPDANHLQRWRPGYTGMTRSLIADYHLGDPQGTADSFRPWRRQRGPL